MPAGWASARAACTGCLARVGAQCTKASIATCGEKSQHAYQADYYTEAGSFLSTHEQAFATALAQLNTNATALLKDAATLKAILNYHVTTTVVASPDALAGATRFRMLNGKSVNVSSSAGGAVLIGETNNAGLASEAAGINGIAGTSSVGGCACLQTADYPGHACSGATTSPP